MPETRRSPDEVVQRRIERSLVAPFTRELPAWQHRLTLLRSRKHATASTADDREAATTELGKLLAEVEQTTQLFDSAVSGHLLDGALRDVRFALQRLADHISEELR